MTHTIGTVSGNVTLAVHSYTEIDRGGPTILVVYGDTDNNHVSDGVTERPVD